MIAHSSAAALAATLWGGHSRSLTAREARAGSVRCTASSGLGRKASTRIHWSGGMHGVEFSSSKSSAKTLSDLQPLLSNVEIQELLREASLPVLRVPCVGFSPFRAVFPRILIISFPFNLILSLASSFLSIFSSSCQQLETELWGEISSCAGRFYPLTRCLL